MNTSVPPTASYPRASRPRARIACSNCHRRKVRCNVAICGQPCTNCQLDGFECVTRPKNPRGSQSSADITHATDTDRTSVIHKSQGHCTRIPAVTDSQMSNQPTPQADGMGTSCGPSSVGPEALCMGMSRNTSSCEFTNPSQTPISSLL
jgi:hypothetical protein